MTKYKSVPGTDGFYDILHDGDVIGRVCKVYSRSVAYWCAYPKDAPRFRRRVAHLTRADARGAVFQFYNDGNTSNVGSEPE